jgi:hypothetical protein
MHSPLCFVLLPCGKKPDGSGRLIDFDAVYSELIAPAVLEAQLEPLRTDAALPGAARKSLLERFILCEVALVDLTGANANLFYELGVRNALRPAATVLLVAEGSGVPLDAARLQTLSYRLTADGRPANPDADRKALVERLQAALQAKPASSVFHLVEAFPDIQRLKTDVFRERAAYPHEIQLRLAAARNAGPEAVQAIEAELGSVEAIEMGVVIDLLLSYRAVQAWKDMIRLVGKMDPVLAATVMVREQLALALNRDGRGEEAEKVLVDLIAQRGSSSETCAILGRVYKDRWEAAEQAGDTLLAQGVLSKAIDAYLQGFEADWRDAFPGINAVTLMELKEPPDPRRMKLLPVVTYAVERRMVSGRPDYWDHATLLELAVLARDHPAAQKALAAALAAVREPWESETTARNLHLIGVVRARRGEALPWAAAIEETLRKAASR